MKPTVKRTASSERVYQLLLKNKQGLSLDAITERLGYCDTRVTRAVLSGASIECAATQPIAVLGYADSLGVYKIAESAERAEEIMRGRRKRIYVQLKIIGAQAKAAETLFNVPRQRSLEEMMGWDDDV